MRILAPARAPRDPKGKGQVDLRGLAWPADNVVIFRHAEYAVRQAVAKVVLGRPSQSQREPQMCQMGWGCHT